MASFAELSPQGLFDSEEISRRIRVKHGLSTFLRRESHNGSITQVLEDYLVDEPVHFLNDTFESMIAQYEIMKPHVLQKEGEQ